jgi:hypothetical protein
VIAKTVIGRSFKGCVNYNLTKVEKGFGEILECRGVRDSDRKSMIQDFIQRTTVNPKLTRSVWHTSLSFQDKLSNQKMLKVAKRWMAGMGLGETQYVIVRHNDTSHHHLHIIANRINDEGCTISDSNNWKRSEALCQELTQHFELTPLPGERNEQKIHREKLRGRDLLKTDINRVIRQVINQSASLEQFALSMSRKGFDCKMKFNPDGSVRGISFERDGIKIKASDIHKSLSAKSIQMMIGQQQNVSNRLARKTDGTQKIAIDLSTTLKKLSREMDAADEDEETKKQKRDRGISM